MQSAAQGLWRPILDRFAGVEGRLSRAGLQRSSAQGAFATAVGLGVATVGVGGALRLDS
jgi:hypothetical protein